MIKKTYRIGLIVFIILACIVAVASVLSSNKERESAGEQGGKMKFEHEFDLEGLQQIEILYLSENIKLHIIDEDKVRITENLSDGRNKKAATTSVSNGCLEVKGEKRQWSLRNLFNFGWKNERIDVYIPARYQGELAISSISGHIEASDSWKLKQFSASAVSGNINLNGISAEYMKVSSVSGNLDIAAVTGSSEISTTSGNIEVEAQAVQGNLSISSVSGNIGLSVPNQSSFQLKGNSVSGRIKTDFDSQLNYNKNKKNVSGSYGSDSSNTVTVHTTSGNININTQKR